MAVESLIGDIPAHWECLTLGEACVRSGGNIQTGPFGSQLHASDYVEEGIPSVMPQNLGQNRIDEEGIARITDADALRLSRYLLRVGDIVYSRRGDVEKRALVTDKEDGWLCGTGCLRVRFGNDSVVPEFVFYYLGHPNVREWIVRHALGATMANLNTSILSALPLVLPPPEEQVAISQILSSLERKSELNRRMSQTLRAMAQAVFKDWFVDFSPVRALAEGRSVSSYYSEWAQIFPKSFDECNRPVGWSITDLAKLCSKIGSGATPRGGRDVYVDDGMNFIRSQNVYDHQFVWSGLVRITAEESERLRNVAVEPNDVLINITGDSILRTCIVEPTVLPARVNQHVSIVRAIERIPPRFLHLYLALPSTKAHLLGNDAGGSRAAITKGHLETLPVLLPSPSVLEAFDQVTAPWFALIENHEAENRTLAELRDVLLPKLISGELCIKAAEKAVV